MAWLFFPFMILLASILGLGIYLIFKFAMKHKTFDEAMAEQRKQLALERNLRFKTKHNQSKKQKSVGKDNSHVDKRSNKIVSSHGSAIKDSKKVEASKSSSVAAVEKVDGNVTSTKKKNDKVQAKPVPSNSTNNSKTSVESAQDNAEVRVDANDNSAKKKQLSTPKNDDSSTSSATHNHNVKNIGEDVSSTEGAVNAETETVTKDKLSRANKNTSVDSGDNTKGRGANPADLNDKLRDSKKPMPKGESDENISKSGGKAAKGGGADERGAAKETKSKSHGEDKGGRSEDKVVKHEELKLVEKTPPSPFKNKKTENNVAEGQIATASVVDATAGEQNAVKEPIASKVDKSSSLVVAGRKQNNSTANGGGMPSGKMSPVAPAKGQKQSNTGKLARRQTNDIKTLQKLSDENCGPVSLNLLMPLIAKAELSRSEYQNLIDLLLNKQQENCIDAEWIEGGRQDPMVKLKKQLAEKEKALCDEQEAHQAIQSKVKELRAELNVEKHTNRQLEETINARQVDLQTLNARLQSMAEEKQNVSKQLQQLQSKMNEERRIVNSLKDENNKTKTSLQLELLSQRQQLELHIAHLNEQHQQEMLTLETQLNQLGNQLQEQEAASAQMTDDIRECVLIRERLVHQENQIAHLQQTVMQLEELRPIKAELERHVASGQFEVKRLSNELQTLTDQLNRRNAEIEKFNSTVQNMKIENQELLKENSRNNEQIKFAYTEKAQLQMENEKLRNELQKLGDQCQSNDDVLRLENELESYRNALADKNTEIKILGERLVVLENSKDQYVSRTAALEEENKSVNELKENLQKQMKKNDDLRSKNWKVMEALSSMEKTLEAKMKGMQCVPHDIKTKERECIVQQLKSILPNASDVDVSNISDDGVWSILLEKILQEIRRARQPPSFLAPPEDTFTKEGNVNMLDELEKQNKQLQTMVSHYKNIISDTEGMLNSLQNHVEQEENRWSEQVLVLQAELKALTEERNVLLNKVKIQNGCVQNDVCNSEQKLNGIDKLQSILPASSSISKTVITS